MNSTAQLTAHDPEAQRRQRVLIAMCLALAAVIASVSALNVALQDLAVEFDASQGMLLWVVNSYTLALAVLLMPIGAIGDRWGRKPVLLTGLALFATASLMAALSTTTAMMLIARTTAGVAAAMIMPVTLSVITSTFPDEQRARAVGLSAGVAGVGGMLGLFFSSFVVDYLTWPWLFTLPMGLALPALAMTWRYVSVGRSFETGRFDVAGSVLSALALGGIVLGIHEAPEKGWGHWLTLGGLVIGVVATVAFVVWERRLENPLLDVRVFAHRGLAAGSVTLLVLFAVMFGLFLVLVQYLQAVLGFSALRAATGLLPMAVVMMPLSSTAPVIAKRWGSVRVMLLGVGLFAVGLALLATLSSVEGGYLSVLPGLVVLGAGMGLAMTPSTMAITESLPTEKQGVASALNDAVREVGGAVGVALLGSVLNSGYRNGVASVTNGLPPELAEPVREGIGGALAVSGQLGADGTTIGSVAREAFVSGWHTSMWVGFTMAVALWLFLAIRAPRHAVPRDNEIGRLPIILGNDDVARLAPVSSLSARLAPTLADEQPGVPRHQKYNSPTPPLTPRTAPRSTHRTVALTARLLIARPGSGRFADTNTAPSDTSITSNLQGSARPDRGPEQRRREQ
jgi:EmrB/QacA subfamily drug resistance transporter